MATIPSIAMIPSGYKAGKVYSVLPTNGDADLTFTRVGALPSYNATRVNENGLIEEVLSNVPRLDYSDGGCPSLLLEPQSTNLLLRSKEFDNASWTSINGGTGFAASVTANAGVAPDGTTTADRVFLDVGAGTNISDFSILNQLYNGTAIPYAFSVYLKSNTETNQNCSIRFNSSPSQHITITTIWQRFTFLGTPSSGNRGYGIDLRGDNPSGQKTCDILAWGAQLEALPYATSYIPTVASTVTRVAETASKTGLSSYINSQEGVLFVEFKFNYLTNNKIIELSDGTSSNRVTIRQNSGLNQFTFSVTSGGVLSYSFNFNVANALIYNKVALSYKSNYYRAFVNGVKENENLNPSKPSPITLSNINFSQFDGVNNSFFGDVKNLQLFNTALSDAELIALTSN